MRLTQVKLWNYRSYWSSDKAPSATLDLSRGVNYLVGTNNVGKSNLLRAVALALDPRAHYDADLDRPGGKEVMTVVELQFEASEQQRTRATTELLEAVQRYEEAAELPSEYPSAKRGIIRLGVTFVNGERIELLQAEWNVGRRRRNLEAYQFALDKLHEAIRFVDIKSGEDLRALLHRGFKEVLASAIGAEHGKAMSAAQKAREAYIGALKEVLRPVGEHVEERLHRYVRDVQRVELLPRVPSVEDALADADVFIQDAVRTALEQKGTGVRGAMLLLLLSFIADSSQSAVVFGIEEPEAFLHPEAQRQLGEGLERFTQRDDVTLLVTTHSPFIFRKDGPDSRSAVFLVRKDPAGRSTVGRDVAETARMDLLGSRVLTSLLQKGDDVPEGTKLLLVVEGYTDRRYFELASERLAIPLEDVHIIEAGGAVAAAIQAVTLRGMHYPERIVAALFDGDDDGRAGSKLLLEKFKWNKKTEVLSYELWIEPENVPVEAEDLFGGEVLERFLAEPGHDAFLDEKKRRPKASVWHYGLTQEGKCRFVEWLAANGTAEMFEGWRGPLAYLHKLIADAETRAARKAAHAAAHEAAHKGES